MKKYRREWQSFPIGSRLEMVVKGGIAVVEMRDSEDSIVQGDVSGSMEVSLPQRPCQLIVTAKDRVDVDVRLIDPEGKTLKSAQGLIEPSSVLGLGLAPSQSSPLAWTDALQGGWVDWDTD